METYQSVTPLAAPFTNHCHKYIYDWWGRVKRNWYKYISYWSQKRYLCYIWTINKLISLFGSSFTSSSSKSGNGYSCHSIWTITTSANINPSHAAPLRWTGMMAADGGNGHILLAHHSPLISVSPSTLMCRMTFSSLIKICLISFLFCLLSFFNSFVTNKWKIE